MAPLAFMARLQTVTGSAIGCCLGFSCGQMLIPERQVPQDSCPSWAPTCSSGLGSQSLALTWEGDAVGKGQGAPTERVFPRRTPLFSLSTCQEEWAENHGREDAATGGL